MTGFNPIGTSLLQATQAQESASRARDREKAEARRAEEQRRDRLELLRVEGVEEVEAARRTPDGASEESEEERGQATDPRADGDADGEDRPRLDLQA